jgi:signal peptidase I
MRSTLKFLMALAVAFVVMLMFRALVFTIYTVPSSSLEPDFKAGDRVMVNRWSYGLRTGGEGLFSYGRLCSMPVEKGDLVAVNDSAGNVQIGRCTALPGDTISYQNRTVIVPGKQNCARHDYYQIAPIGLVREEQIIGRVALVVYNHTPGDAFWKGYDSRRLLLPIR